MTPNNSKSIFKFLENATEKEKRDLRNELEIMAAVGEHPNVINLIAACTETGISQFSFKPGHRCKFIKFYEHIVTPNFVMAKHELKTCLW